jgi:hypothetical protein
MNKEWYIMTKHMYEAIAIKTCGGEYAEIKYIGTSNFLEVADAIAFQGYSLQSPYSTVYPSLLRRIFRYLP